MRSLDRKACARSTNPPSSAMRSPVTVRVVSSTSGRQPLQPLAGHERVHPIRDPRERSQPLFGHDVAQAVDEPAQDSQAIAGCGSVEAVDQRCRPLQPFVGPEPAEALGQPTGCCRPRRLLGLQQRLDQGTLLIRQDHGIDRSASSSADTLNYGRHVLGHCHAGGHDRLAEADAAVVARRLLVLEDAQPCGLQVRLEQTAQQHVREDAPLRATVPTPCAEASLVASSAAASASARWKPAAMSSSLTPAARSASSAGSTGAGSRSRRWC